MTETEQIVSWLEDEESKFIYKKRVEYNETHNYERIKEIVNTYLPQLSKRRYYPGIAKELVGKIKNRKKIAVFGLGFQGKEVLDLLEKAGVAVDTVLDNNSGMWERNFHNVVVKNPTEVDYDKFDTIIISPYNNAWVQSIEKQLLHYGVKQESIILYKDYLPYMLEEEQYFDENIIKWEEEEAFVDAGVLDLETSINFCNVCNRHGVKKCKVYAYEPDEKSYMRCKEIMRKYPDYDIELHQEGLWKENTTIYFDMRGDGASRITGSDSTIAVPAVALDQSIKDNKVTFIKMDIEGAELEALHGAKKIIQTQKPKLAICIYHKKEDMIQIPKYIKELVPEYKLYVRHYSNDAGETVLYAVL